ncbi:hypothetical protein EMIHUDRAFT_123942, partial [Emiliania huxleyi CCMP1516]|uniref:Uncharacterized protein n=2 Tax=Emiliania huxleyi TaxID=2903 RepID=A0A0D3J9H3_EMIH1
MFFDDKPKVNLRGKSSSSDRQLLLARAQRERDERQRQRALLRAALLLQSAARAHMALARAREAIRSEFDAAVDASLAQRVEPGVGGSLAAGFASLVRQLLFFHAAPLDDGRRTWLLGALVEALAAEAAAAPSSGLLRASLTPSLTASLVALCLQRLAAAAAGSAGSAASAGSVASSAAPAFGSAAPPATDSLPLELRAA